MMNIAYRLFDYFDLVVAFVGSAACCPVLEVMMQRHPSWDPRFFFPEWNQKLIDTLLMQQQKLRKEGVTRNILIIMDDVVLDSKATDQLSHICMRGRHFNVSAMMCAVSYTCISKRCRRSMDYLLVFSCPMTGDRKILGWEFSSNLRIADFGLKNLDENQCVVFETSRKQQKLWVWKAELLTVEDFQKGNKRLPSLAGSKTSPDPSSPAGRRWDDHRRRNASHEDRTSPPGSSDEGSAGSMSPRNHGNAPQSERECPQ